MAKFYCGAGRDKGSWIKIVEFQFEADGRVGNYLTDVFEMSEAMGSMGRPPLKALQIIDKAMAEKAAASDGADLEERQAMLMGLVLVRESIVATAKAGYEDFAVNVV